MNDANNKNKQLLLTKDEARCIRDALCAMNVVGAPQFMTAIHRPASEFLKTPERTIVFDWLDKEDDLTQVMIYTTKMHEGLPIQLIGRNTVVERHDTQNAFFKAYGLDD